MRFAVISDIHANLAAFEAVLADIGDRVDRIWCLGDIVGYGPDPNECVERVRQDGIISVVGNHDWACLGRVDLSQFNPDAARACHWTIEQLTPENRDYLGHLPVSLTIDQHTLVHGSPRGPIWEYIAQPEAARENFSHFDTPVCLVGHTHVPLAFNLPDEAASSCDRYWLSSGETLDISKGRWILNPGGLGQPRDGDPRAPYLIIDAGAMRLEVCRVPYPIELTQSRMAQAGLPGSLSVRLSFGW